MAGNIEFNLQLLDEFVKKVKVAPAVAAKRIGFDLFGRIVRKTPVDTGRARASWNISVNQPDLRVVEEVATVAAGTTATNTMGARSAVKAGINALQTKALTAVAVQEGDKIFITNNLPYIVKLEEGHSKQAPAGMVAVSIEEVGVNMESLLAQAIKEAGL